MPLLDATALRALFDIATGIANDRLEFCLRNASRTLKGWVGDDAYADAILGDEADDTDAAEALKDAESYLAMYHALLNTAAHIRKSGIVSKEMDAAGPLAGGNVQNQYYTPAELIALRNEYFSQAETLAAPYLATAEAAAVLGAGTITMKGGTATGFD